MMNEKKISAVEEKISNASMLLNEIKSHYDEERIYEKNISLEQRVCDFKKLIIAIDILYDCQMRIEDYITDITDYSKNLSDADARRVETINLFLGMDEEDLEKLRSHYLIVCEKGGAA